MLLVLMACSELADPRASFEAGKYRAAYNAWLPRAEQGDASAQNYIGVLYFCGWGVARDPGLARNWFGRSALQGNASAQRNLGMLFEQGRGVPRDIMRAIGWYFRAGRGGNPRGFEALQAMGSEVTTNQTRQGEAIVAADIAAGRISTR